MRTPRSDIVSDRLSRAKGRNGVASSIFDDLADVDFAVFSVADRHNLAVADRRGGSELNCISNDTHGTRLYQSTVDYDSKVSC